MNKRVTTRTEWPGDKPGSGERGLAKRGAAVLLGFVTLAAVVALQPSATAQSPPSSERFTLVMGGEAVKDNKTGLMWEQSPDLIHDTWSASVARCPTKLVGGEKGWRAPSVEELKSLIDSSQTDPALPEGHPFFNIKSEIYWSATPSKSDDIVAWQVSFFTGEPVTDQKSGTRRIWCVLGES
ncbi:MAG: DUF1566 domain-containing protein [Nitrospiraceae bacterium]